jgi:trk system potassium uptake protein
LLLLHSIMMIRIRVHRAHPATLVLVSFLLAIIGGMLVLRLPVCTKAGYIPWMDALFTATSAVCVTGLVVVDTGSYFTIFGQWVILILIQIGGLGVMTISVTLFRWIGRSVSFRNRMAMQDLFTHTPRDDIFNLIKSISLFTLVAEAIGTVFLIIHWSRELPFWWAIHTAIFHSVSAFCNAGFALFSDSMMHYSNNLLLNATICTLIVVGGIGFPVLYDLQFWFLNQKKKRPRLSVQTKTVLLTTLALIITGSVIFAFLEQEALGDALTLQHRILISLFQSITCRTAGFNTVDIASLKEATLAMMIFLMFFGASPGSCGGGVKTTTLALMGAFTISQIKRSRRVNLFKKSIPDETVTRSVLLILLSIAIVGIILFMLLIGNAVNNHEIIGTQSSFLVYLFETVSAFGTVGLSMGLTPQLNTWGKCCIVLMMIIGRVGVLTFAYIIVGTRRINGIEYSEENLMIG